jgi:hypothetical protein
MLTADQLPLDKELPIHRFQPVDVQVEHVLEPITGKQFFAHRFLDRGTIVVRALSDERINGQVAG